MTFNGWTESDEQKLYRKARAILGYGYGEFPKTDAERKQLENAAQDLEAAAISVWLDDVPFTDPAHVPSQADADWYAEVMGQAQDADDNRRTYADAIN